MKLLLDTHVFLWWITDSPKLSPAARNAIADSRNEAFFSAASVWEAAIKFALGRLPLPAEPENYFPTHLERSGIQSLPISDEHAYRAASLPPHHADPFDRMLISQTVAQRLILVTSDAALRAYEVDVLW